MSKTSQPDPALALAKAASNVIGNWSGGDLAAAVKTLDAALSEYRTARIRQLNDVFRTTGLGGRFLLTVGIRSLGPISVAKIVTKIREFSEFSDDNDPHREHDFGSIDHDGNKIFWKIDYYDLKLEAGSEDPCDPEITCRVLTVMLAEEY